jgi:hypothetical protein
MKNGEIRVLLDSSYNTKLKKKKNDRKSSISKQSVN